jgi:spore coat protein U-like protein
MRYLSRAAGVFAACVIGACLAGPALAQSCAVTTNAVTFGNYNPFSASPLDSTGNVRVTCSAVISLAMSYSIQIDAGGSGSTLARSMGGPGLRLPYQLYRDLARTQIWGDGTGGNLPVTDAYLLILLVPVARDYPVYGRIPPGSQVTPGGYADIVNVLVTY